MRVPTWENKDEAGGQASDDRDDLADVRDEERQQQGEQEPDEGLQHAPPPLAPHVLLHGHPLIAQPQAFDHRPARKDVAQRSPSSSWSETSSQQTGGMALSSAPVSCCVKWA